MSEASPADLLYGHLGEAIYDDESNKWFFTRTPYISRKFKPLGEPFTVVDPSLPYLSTDKIQSAPERTQNTKKLTRIFPELVPALPLLPKLTQASEIIDRATTAHDPAKASLLAFGKAEDRIHKRSKDLHIAAIACGSACDTLRLVLLRKEKLGWEDDKELGLRRLAFKGAEQGCWSGKSGPILQVCFAQTKGKSRPWLAVRYHCATAILYPLLMSNPVQANSSPLSLSRYPSSRLDANHIATLSIQTTGGFPHADVSFNPWDNMQIGIVDDQGYWTLWRLNRHAQRTGFWTTKAGLSGHIAEGNVKDSESEPNNNDGWGTILWAGSGDTIVVANRRMLSLFQIKNNTKRLISPNLSLSGSADLILDVRRSPSDDNHIFVTTCTRIFWLHIPPSGDSQSDKKPELEASVLLSWRHFRDQEDISLRISVLKDEETTMVILYSSLTAISTVFSFQISIVPPGLPLSVSDPFLLPLIHKGQNRYAPILSHCSSTKQPSVTTLELNRVKYDILDESPPAGLGSQYRECGIRFYQLTILYNDQSLCECLYASQLTSDFTQIQPPRTRKLAGTLKIPTKVVDHGFIVPNRLSPGDFEDFIRPPVSQEQKKGKTAIETLHSEEDPWTLNFEWLERKISELSPRSSADQVSQYNPRTPFDDCLDLIRSAIIEKVADSTSGIETLYDALDTNPFIEDIDAASKKARSFVASIERISEDGKVIIRENLVNSLQVSKLITPQLMTALGTQTRSGQDLSLSQIYDNLLKSWTSALSRAIPSRVRAATEKRLGEIATYLYLASFGIVMNSKSVENENENIEQETVPMEQQLNLPVRRRRSLSDLPIKTLANPPGGSSSPLVSSQISEDAGFLPPSQPPSQPLAPALPTPEMTPSLRSRSSISSLGAALEDGASKRLRVLASLTPQPALPASASDILQHWTEGINPDDYDWETIQNSMVAEYQDPGDIKDESSTKKRQRLEKRLKRQRENELGSSSQPLPTIVGESQPSTKQEPQQDSSVEIKVGGGMTSQMSRSSMQWVRQLGRKKRREGF